MLKLAAIGDIHLHEKSPRYAHTLEVLDWTIDDALAQGATGFIFLGDLCEGRPSPQEGHALKRRFRRIEQAGGWVAGIEGNHEDPEAGLVWDDFDIRRSAWNAFEEIHDEATILLVPYPRRGRPPFDTLKDDGTIRGSITAAAERIAAAVSGACKAAAWIDGPLPVRLTPVIVLGHFTMAGMMTRDTRFEQHTATEVIVPIEALHGAAFVGVGHIHREGWYCAACAAWVAGWLPGCTCGALASAATLRGVGGLIRHSFGEVDDHKSYTLLTVDGGRVTWERRAVPARTMVVETIDWPLTESTQAGLTIGASLDMFRGQEIKLTVSIPEDQLATFDPTVFDAIKGAAAYFALDKQTQPIERTRAMSEAMAAATTPSDQLTAWLNSIAYEGGEADRATLAAMLAEVTS